MKKMSMLLGMLILNVHTVFAGTIENVIGGPADPVEVDKDFAGRLLGSMQIIAYIIAVGMLIYFGIKYVTSAADERADLKKGFSKYFIGAVLIACAFTIANLMYN